MQERNQHFNRLYLLGGYMTYKLTELPSIYDLLARIEKLEKELANVSNN